MLAILLAASILAQAEQAVRKADLAHAFERPAERAARESSQRCMLNGALALGDGITTAIAQAEGLGEVLNNSVESRMALRLAGMALSCAGDYWLRQHDYAQGRTYSRKATWLGRATVAFGLAVLGNNVVRILED